MRFRRILAPIIAGAALAVTGAATANAASAPALERSGPVVAATPLNQCSATFYDGDSRLGPAQLPLFGPVGLQLFAYARTGLYSPQQFLAQFYSPTANNGSPGWIYPPDNGYVIDRDGNPVEWTATLSAGADIDRYGSEYGSFLAPAGTPYGARSIPPSSLDGNPAGTCNYHDYTVLKPFQVDAGPIAPWFAQLGGGLQYQLDGSLVPGAPAQLNVMWLVDNGYLGRIS